MNNSNVPPAPDGRDEVVVLLVTDPNSCWHDPDTRRHARALAAEPVTPATRLLGSPPNEKKEAGVLAERY